MCAFPVVPALLLLGGVLGRRCARSVCDVACTVSWASWLLFTGVLAPCVVFRVRRPGPPGSSSPPCTPCARCCVHGFLAPAYRRARSVCGVAGAVSCAAWFPFTGVHALRVLLHARCLGPLGSCYTGVPVCVLCSVFGCKSSCHSCPALHRRTGPLAPRDNHSLAEGHWIFSVYCLAYGFLCLGALCCVYGVLGPSALVHRCARVVCGVVCAASWASWLLVTGARARCVLLACFLSRSLILACSCACSP